MTLALAIARAARGLQLPERVPQFGNRLSSLTGGGLFGAGAQSGMQAYREVGAAYGPIRRICESVALVEWSLYAQTDKPGQVDLTLLDNAEWPAKHPGTALWTQPNPFMSRRVFLFLQQLWQETTGGCYWLICRGGPDGDPFPQRGLQADLELWPIRPDRITPIPDPDKYLAGYVYQNGAERIPLPVQAVVALGWPDPLDPLKFAGPLQAAGVDLDSERYASQFTRAKFQNGATPGGVIEFDTPLPRDRFEELVLRWREQHQGVNNAARVAIIEGGKWVEASQTNRELQFVDLRRFDREQVMFALGMPFAMMQTTDINLANAQIGQKLFNRYTLTPRLESIKEPFNQRVLSLLGDNLTMNYSLPAPEDEAFDVYASSMGWLAGLLTKNEGRAGMGYDAVDDGEQYVNDLTGVAPQIPGATPPRRPSALSYRKRPEAPHERPMADAWAGRLEQIRTQYLDYIGGARNASGH